MTDITAQGVRSAGFFPLYAGHAMVHLYVGIFPALLIVLRREFEANYATLGAVFSAAMAAYGVGALLTGLVLNRVAPLTVVRLYLAGAAAAALSIAAAPGEVTFAIALFALGLACSPYHTAGLTFVSRVSGNDARLLGHHGMAGNLGLAGAPAFAVVLASLGSWRAPFAVAAALGVATALWTLRMRGLHDPGIARPVSPDPDAASPDPGGATHVRALVLVFAITVALGFIYRGMATYLPTLAAERTDILPFEPVVRGGVLATFVYLFGFFGQWLGGRLGGGRWAERTYALLLGVTALVLALTVFASDWLLLALLALTSFVHFTTQPMDNVFTGRYTSLGRRGLGYGLSFALSFGVGAVAAWAGGVVADAAGGQVRYVWALLAGVAAIGTALAVLLARLAREEDGEGRPSPL